MSIFIKPRTKNPPAKVKDKGIINLVMDGAGAYNAKNGELLLLPYGRAEADRVLNAFLEGLFNGCGFQPVDCLGSEEAVFSLAERYAREYKEQALFWSQENGRDLELYGWGAAPADVAEKMERAAAVISEAASPRARITFLTDTGVSAAKALTGVSPTDKTAERALPGFKCSSCGAEYLPDSACESRETVNADAAAAELRDVHTPGAHTIPLLCGFMNIPVETTLKAMLYTLELVNGDKKLLFAMIRGDRDISIPKLAAWVGANYPGAGFRRAEETEIVGAFGEVAGFCGPVGVPDNVQMLADLSLEGGKNFVVGGNRPDYHRSGCCWGRDFEPPLADLVLYTRDLPCPECGGELAEAWFRKICRLEYYESKERGENILSCRDRDGAYIWSHRLRGTIGLIPVILAMYENKEVSDVD